MSDERSDEEGALVHVASDVADRTPVNWGERAGALARSRAGASRACARSPRCRKRSPPRRDAAPGARCCSRGDRWRRSKESARARSPRYRAWGSRAASRGRARCAARSSNPRLGGRRWIEEARRLARAPSARARDPRRRRARRPRGAVDRADLGRHAGGMAVRAGPLGAREAAGAGMDLCHALGRARDGTPARRRDHAQRDARRPRGRPTARAVVLMDFGSARRRARATWSRSARRCSWRPRCSRARSPTRARRPLLLGVVLYRLLTGRYPVEPGSIDDMRAKLERGERTPLRTARPTCRRRARRSGRARVRARPRAAIHERRRVRAVAQAARDRRRRGRAPP